MPSKSYNMNNEIGAVSSRASTASQQTTSNHGSTDNIINQSSSSLAGSATPTRGNWGSQTEFLLACIGYAIGLGNVWRFPHLVFRNGGGAFLVPFILMVLVIALPIFFSELFIGQYTGVGPNKAYARMSPFFQGLGYCTLLVITYVTIYYMVIIAWIVFYTIASFSSELPWGSCLHDFNTNDCYSAIQDQLCRADNQGNANDQIFWGRKCMSVQEICSTRPELTLNGFDVRSCQFPNGTLIPLSNVINRVLASEEYFNEHVLGVGDATWYNFGWPRWQLVLCLLFSWVIAFLCLIKGIQSAGKVVYFTALFPYVILTALLIRGVTLEGAVDGVLFYIRPEWDRLSSPTVWADAASQVFYSFGIACSSLVTFASYNHFRSNIHTLSLIVTVTNVLTAIFAGFAIFAVLGFMARNLEMPISEVVSEGPGLAFIAYPEAVLLMPLPQLWAVLFFFMMFILGMGSQFGGIEAINTAIIDYWPHLRKHKWRVTAGTCTFCFIAALPMVCNGGVYLFTLMEWHTASWAILLLGFAEIVVISWVYGIDRAMGNLLEMGMKLHVIIRRYWWVVWTILTPVASLAIFIYTLTDITPTQYRDYVFPPWADALGWMMGATTLIPFPVAIFIRYYKDRLSWKQFFSPSHKWGPQQDEAEVPIVVGDQNQPNEPNAIKPNGIESAEFI